MARIWRHETATILNTMGWQGQEVMFECSLISEARWADVLVGLLLLLLFLLYERFRVTKKRYTT